MADGRVELPLQLDAEYGIKVKGVLRVFFTHTDADKAPRNRFDQAEYPDSPESVSVHAAYLVMDDILVKNVTSEVDLADVETAVLQQLQCDRERERDEAYYDDLRNQGFGT